MRALFGGRCRVCRDDFNPNDLVFRWRVGFVCVPCQRRLDHAPSPAH